MKIWFPENPGPVLVSAGKLTVGEVYRVYQGGLPSDLLVMCVQFQGGSRYICLSTGQALSDIYSYEYEEVKAELIVS